jgi:hypothetical protein
MILAVVLVLGSEVSSSVEMAAIPWRVQPVGMEPLLLHLATPIMMEMMEINSFSRKGTASRSTAMTTIGRLSKPSIVAGGAAVEAKSGDGANESIAVAAEEEASERVVEGGRRRQEAGLVRTMDRLRRGQREKPAWGHFIRLGTISEAVLR